MSMKCKNGLHSYRIYRQYNCKTNGITVLEACNECGKERARVITELGYKIYNINYMKAQLRKKGLIVR